MSQSLGNQMPPDLIKKLDRGELFRAGGLALTVLSTDEAGWPHVAMAPGAVAGSANQIYFALGAFSRSLTNVQRTGQATLLVAAPETLYYIKGKVEVVKPAMQVMEQEAAVKLTITDVISDQESFVTVTSGIGYRYNLMHDDFVKVIGAMLDELAALAEAA